MAVKFLVIGGANVDIKGRMFQSTVFGTSNPGQVWKTAGGVARNIAEDLAVLGNRVCLIAAIGQDDNGEFLLRKLRLTGIDVEHMLKCPTHPTGVYLAMVRNTGELELAVSDMSVMECLTPEVLVAREAAFRGVRFVFLDANLPAQTLALGLRMAKARELITVVDPVSAAKSLRLLPCLADLDLITPNRDELAAMTGMTVQHMADVERAALHLRHQGVKRVIVTLGEQGVFMATEAGERHLPAKRVDVVDVTGAGDAFTAGILHGWQSGMSFPDAVQLGQELAAQIVQSTFSVLNREGG
ncbi:hypothetical protein D2Q93_12305 [Alicyclobacillaceae bacterium I2511]|nr:hypothetical protein D2Q93_12305 [Alicyclobacillaceae bacterium I2511]